MCLMHRGLLNTLLLVFVTSAVLTACGNKGPLYVPQAEKADVAKEADKKKTRIPGDSAAK